MGQGETKSAWWNAGFHLPKDSERGKNEGLSAREIRALSEENMRPWGQSIFASSAVSRRAANAQKAAKKRQAAAKKKGKKG
jgi:hypothetical protein